MKASLPSRSEPGPLGLNVTLILVHLFLSRFQVSHVGYASEKKHQSNVSNYLIRRRKPISQQDMSFPCTYTNQNLDIVYDSIYSKSEGG